MIASQVMAVAITILGIGAGLAAVIPPLMEIVLGIIAYLKKMKQDGVVNPKKTQVK